MKFFARRVALILILFDRSSERQKRFSKSLIGPKMDKNNWILRSWSSFRWRFWLGSFQSLSPTMNINWISWSRPRYLQILIEKRNIPVGWTLLHPIQWNSVDDEGNLFSFKLIRWTRLDRSNWHSSIELFSFFEWEWQWSYWSKGFPSMFFFFNFFWSLHLQTICSSRDSLEIFRISHQQIKGDLFFPSKVQLKEVLPQIFFFEQFHLTNELEKISSFHGDQWHSTLQIPRRKRERL